MKGEVTLLSSVLQVESCPFLQVESCPFQSLLLSSKVTFKTTTYIVNREAGLSPGEYTEKYAEKCSKQRKRVQERSQLPSTKRRRLELKMERAITQGANEVLEGQSYESGIGHDPNADIEQIPDPVPKGIFHQVQLHGVQPIIITFDLETTDLVRGDCFPDITQIAAFHSSTGQFFDQYVLPEQPISCVAQQVTGLMLSNGKLFHLGTEVSAVQSYKALDKFITWLEQFNNIILFAHNGRRFDFRVLCSSLQSVNLIDRFFNIITGCVDTLPLFKHKCPNLSSYKQEVLVKHVLDKTYKAHDALEDVRSLSDLLLHVCNDPSDFLQFSFSLKSVFQSVNFNKEKVKNMPSLNVLVASGVCKRATAENIAGSGLNMRHLEIIFGRDGEDGLRNVFIAKNSEGQPRITSVKRTLETVIPKLAEYFQSQNR